MTPRRGHLYVADVHPRFGAEPGKQRPGVVIQNDALHDAGHPTTWILPCTTRLTGSNALRVQLAAGVAGNAEDCEVMIVQIRAVDVQRLRRLLGPVPDAVLREVEAKLRVVAQLG
jgi:mRNA interferase MazF